MMLAKTAYGTPLGEWSYGQPGQPKQPPAPQPASPQPKKLDMSAYAPGRAQPKQPQSQGTPFQAYSPQGPNGGVQTPGGEMWYSRAPQQPPPVTQSATGVNGQQFADPSQAFTQRDALIQRINEARAPMFAGAGTYLGEGAPPPTWGQKPPLDFNTLMGQANDMVANGWQNPFAPQQRGDITPETMMGGVGEYFSTSTAYAPPGGERSFAAPGVNISQGDPGSVQRYIEAQRQFRTPQRAPMGDALPPAPASTQPVIRHWTDNPAYQQPAAPTDVQNWRTGRTPGAPGSGQFDRYSSPGMAYAGMSEQQRQAAAGNKSMQERAQFARGMRRYNPGRVSV